MRSEFPAAALLCACASLLQQLLPGLLLLPVLLLVPGAQCVQPGPAHPPTRGAPWPQPQQHTLSDRYYTFNPSAFTVQITGHNCTILWKAIHRFSYVGRLHRLARRLRRRRTHTGRRPPAPAQCGGTLSALRLRLAAPCEDTPHLHMDEAYNLTVTDGAATLDARAVWGALRGLETLAQLFYIDDDRAEYPEVRINETEIVDWPRHPHRGLLLDTARHFLPLPTLRAALDALAADKMNVLHWHLTDDQSFPYRSDLHPELSERGAYHPSMVYTAADIESVVQYATERGIRVIPEFDVPGHTRSWGESHPELLTRCGDGSLGPLQPLRDDVYSLLRSLLQEAAARFPDTHRHLGGDEVDLECWLQDPELLRWLREHNTTDVTRLHAFFMSNTLALLPPGTKPIVWQEVFDESVPLPADSLVHVWKGGVHSMAAVIEAGHRVLYSTAWYLDHLGDTLDTFLDVDPRRDVEARLGPEAAARVLGGEAAMWGEMVDERNVLQRSWPRASAAAERLWSAPEQAGSREHTRRRAEEHACRLARRRLPAAPAAGPGYCLLAP